MGLDTVELVLKVEDTFQVKISDRDAESLVTVGELYDYVRQHVGRGGICPSQHVFYRLRSALGIRCWPNDPLDVLLPAERRVRTWNGLAASAAIEMPALRRPGWVSSLGWSIFAIAAVATLISIIVTREIYPMVWLTAVAIVIHLLWLMTAPLAVHFPLHCGTAGDLARLVAANNAGKLRASLGWSDEEIWKTLLLLISEQSGVAPEALKPEQEFVRDLGLD